jgi:hypothetical protein
MSSVAYYQQYTIIQGLDYRKTDIFPYLIKLLVMTSVFENLLNVFQFFSN